MAPEFVFFGRLFCWPVAFDDESHPRQAEQDSSSQRKTFMMLPDLVQERECSRA